PYFAQLEKLGMANNYVVRIRGGLDSLRKCLYRISYIQKIEFVPSVNVLIQTLVCAVVLLLLFLKSDGSAGSYLIFGFVSYLFVFAVHLIAVFNQPFRQGEHSPDKVSLYLLRELAAKLLEKQSAANVTTVTTSMAQSRRAELHRRIRRAAEHRERELGIAKLRLEIGRDGAAGDAGACGRRGRCIGLLVRGLDRREHAEQLAARDIGADLARDVERGIEAEAVGLGRR